MTWEMLLKLLQQVTQGGIATVPCMPTSTFDVLRPLVLTIGD